MKRAVFLLLLSVWVFPASAEPRDVLVDDFGEPLQHSDILPPARIPQSVAVPKPAKEIKKVEQPIEPESEVIVKKAVVQKPAPAKKPVLGAKPKPKKVAAKKSVKVVPPPASMKKAKVPEADEIVIERVKEEKTVPEIEVFGSNDGESAPPAPKAELPKPEKKVMILPPPLVKITPPEAVPEPSKKGDKLAGPKAVIPPAPSISSHAKSSTPPEDIFTDSDNSSAGKGKGDKILPVPPPPPVKSVVQTLPKTRSEVPVVKEPAILPTQPLPPVNDDSDVTQDKKDRLPLARVPPAPSKKEIEIFGDSEASSNSRKSPVTASTVDDERDLASDSMENEINDGKKGGLPQAKIPPVPPRLVQLPVDPILPLSKFQDQVQEVPHRKQIIDRAPVMEHLPVDIDAYIDTSRTPKYIRINIDGQNIRNSPEFQTGRSDNIYDKNIAGSFYAVSRIVPTEEGVATGIYVDGEEKWVFMPWEKRNDFQYCESEACFADISLGLNAIAEMNDINSSTLLACGITGVDGDGRAVRNPLPRKIEVAELPPRLRSLPEVEELDSHLSRSPKIKVEYNEQEGCVVDTRDRAKPNFRNYSGMGQRSKAFVAYMTPFALEVQEETGLPASVIIAQAALESGWGKSGLFTETKNIFGHSCWEAGSSKTYNLRISGERKSVRGTCDRPRSTGGYYMEFKDSQDSVYAYAANLLTHPAYPQVQAAVRRAKPEPADWRSVVSGLREYDGPNPEYRQLLRDIILKNDLQKLENKKLCH